MLSKSQKLLLAQLVRENKTIVFDETVLDILGRESANLEPVKVEDSKIMFEKEVVVCTKPGSEGTHSFSHFRVEQHHL